MGEIKNTQPPSSTPGEAERLVDALIDAAHHQGWTEGFFDGADKESIAKSKNEIVVATARTALLSYISTAGRGEGAGDGLGDGRRIYEALGFDPINHHNALKCPYCNPNGMVLVLPAATERAGDLAALSRKATQGEWHVESEKTDGSYGSGEDCSEGYYTAVICTDEIRHGKPGVIFEGSNSTVAEIEEENHEDGFHAWDAVSKANAEFIVALVNAYRSGRLVERSATNPQNQE